MSRFLKRVIILKDDKQNSAIVKIESGVSGYFITLKCDEKLFDRNLKLGVLGENDFCMFDLSKEINSTQDLSNQVAVAIFNGDDVIYFGGTSPYVTKSTLLDKKRDYDNFSSDFLTDFNQNNYDDEKIATENYFENRLIDKDLSNYETTTNSDANAQKKTESIEKETEFSKKIREYETDSSVYESKDDFYKSRAKQKLADLFSVCEKVTSLSSVLPNSKFVKVNYTTSQSYIVGIIEENCKPKYICYGVDGKYGYPPPTLKDFCHFIPKSLFNLHADGYYMIFQNAKTGETVTPKIDVFGI